MAELKAILPKAEKYVSIVWQVSDLCNFRCPYCSETYWAGKNRGGDVAKQKEVLGKVFDHYLARGYRSFKIFFSGGEPTLWPSLREICEFGLGYGIPALKFAINTNLSRSLDWWEKHHQYFDDVIASFHIEHAKPDEFLRNFTFLGDKVNYLVARMMMHDERFDDVLAFSERLKSTASNYVLEYVPLFRELSHRTEPYEYKDPRKMEFFRHSSFETKHTTHVPVKSAANTASVELYNDGSRVPLNSNRLVAERKNFFEGWRCFLSDSLFISSSGDITSGACGVRPRFGNVNEGWIEFQEDSLICPKQQCHCGTDIYIRKTSPGWKGEGAHVDPS